MTRALSHRERSALDALLAAEFGGADELRAQAKTVSAANVGLVVELVVDRSLPTAVVPGRVPVEADVEGDGYRGGVILIVDEGRLSGLEYWWVTDVPPKEFPPAEAIGRAIPAS
ncbi:hypothetical protein ACSMXN_07600 [Jatrophihabitans sp. DSM 45814]